MAHSELWRVASPAFLAIDFVACISTQVAIDSFKHAFGIFGIGFRFVGHVLSLSCEGDLMSVAMIAACG